MLSGALLLGRVWDIKSFLGKRIPRIVLPFVFWGLILTFLLILIVLEILISWLIMVVLDKM